MPSSRDPTVASSSSEAATESENSCTERYDYEKSPTSASRRVGGGASILSRSESESELRRVADNLKKEQSRDGVADLEFFNAQNDQTSLRHYRQRNDRLSTDGQQQQRLGKRANQRPASVKSSGSYDIRDSGVVLRESVGRGGFESEINSGGQHEHYMVPTREPDRPSDKRTLSLFNPDFLPNFNDMLMYVGRSEAVNDRGFYRCNNVEDPPWGEPNGPSIVDCSSRSFDKNSFAIIDGGNSDFSRSNIEASYASLRLNDRSSLQQLRDQDCENIYAPVGLQAFQSQGRIDYDC